MTRRAAASCACSTPTTTATFPARLPLTATSSTPFVGRVQAGLVGLIDLVHQPSGIADPKLLVNLMRADADAIMAFLDQGDPGPQLDLVWRQAAR